jgi:hypothetical protein
MLGELAIAAVFEAAEHQGTEQYLTACILGAILLCRFGLKRFGALPRFGLGNPLFQRLLGTCRWGGADDLALQLQLDGSRSKAP